MKRSTVLEPPPDVGRRLVEIATSVRYADLPSDVRRLAMRIVVDTLAAAKAGMQHPFCSAYVRDVASRAAAGHSSALHGPHLVTAELAAFVNALPATVLQIDEGHRKSRGHPGIHVVPTALAVAEEVDAGGDALIEAVVSGYEIAARVGLLLGALPHEVHPHGTWGAFGAAVSAARLLRLRQADFERLIDAVACVPLRPWARTATQGATVHHLYAPLANQLALIVTRSLLAGATVTAGAFSSFYVPAFGSTTSAWDAPGYEISNYYFKFYPACAHVHTAVQAIERLQADHAFNPDDVLAVKVETYRAAFALSDTAPRSDLAARFSIPFCVARQLLHRSIGDYVLTPTELGEERTLALAKKVTTWLDPELDRQYPDARPARVKVSLRDGRTVSAHETMPRGDSARPESEKTWKSKIARLVGADAANQLLEFVDRDPAQWSARELGRVLAERTSL